MVDQVTLILSFKGNTYSDGWIVAFLFDKNFYDSREKL